MVYLDQCKQYQRRKVKPWTVIWGSGVGFARRRLLTAVERRKDDTVVVFKVFLVSIEMYSGAHLVNSTRVLPCTERLTKLTLSRQMRSKLRRDEWERNSGNQMRQREHDVLFSSALNDEVTFHTIMMVTAESSTNGWLVQPAFEGLGWSLARCCYRSVAVTD